MTLADLPVYAGSAGVHPNYHQFVPQPRDQYGTPIIGGPAPLAYPSGGTSITDRIRNLVGSFDVAPTPTGNSGYIPSMNWTGAGRPVGSVIATPKSPQVQMGVNQAYGTNAANTTAARQSLADWTKEYLAGQPAAQQYSGQETAAIGRVYGSGPGSVAGNLADIRQQRATALRDLTQGAYRRADRTQSLRQLGAGGTNSSYLQRAYAQDLGNIAANSAVQGADQQRADELYLNQQQLGNVGTRQELQDRLLGRNLMPAQVASGLEQDATGRLGSIANLDYANNFYAPAEDAYSRRIAYLQQLAAMGYQ